MMLNKTTLIALSVLQFACFDVIAGSGSPNNKNLEAYGGKGFNVEAEHYQNCQKNFVRITTYGGCSSEPVYARAYTNGCTQKSGRPKVSAQVVMDPGSVTACRISYGWEHKTTGKSNYHGSSTTGEDDHAYIRVIQAIDVDQSNIKDTSIGGNDVQIYANATTADLDIGRRTKTNTKLTYVSETDQVCTVSANGLASLVGQLGNYTSANVGECRIRIESSRKNSDGSTNDNFSTTGYTTYIGWKVSGEIDTDDDGISDLVPDNCPTVKNGAIEEAAGNGISQNDQDTDGIGDVCDDNIDGDVYAADVLAEDGIVVLHAMGDEILNADDNCPTTANPDQASSVVLGIGEACINDDPDLDNDGVLNLLDNCPFIANGVAKDNQSNIDGDTLGDACDEDLDDDGVSNVLDNCPNTPNTEQVDDNENGQGDACESKFVSVDAGLDSATCGSSWGNACKSLQFGINAADADGLDAVFVSRGVYKPASTVVLKKGVDLVGGFVGGELSVNEADPMTNVTTIDGSVAGQALSATALGLLEGDEVELSGFTLNKASNSALFVTNSVVKVTKSTFTDNTAVNGSAILATDKARVVVENVDFLSNNATSGGAISASDALTFLAISNSTFVENTSVSTAGAIFLASGSELVVADSQFDRNTSDANAGAIQVTNAKLSIIDSSFVGNKALAGAGGAIGADGGNVLIETTAFDSNTSTANGGALSLATTATIRQSLFVSNETSAGSGGAIEVKQLAANDDVVIENSSFYANKASQSGGVAEVAGGTLLIKHATMISNDSQGDAGALHVNGGVLQLQNSLLQANTAATQGANISHSSGTFTDVGYNLIGFNDESGLNNIILSGTGSFTASATEDAEGVAKDDKKYAITLEEIVSVSPSFKGGDDYIASLKTLSLPRTSIALNKIPASACPDSNGKIYGQENYAGVDQRGELRPNVTDEKCDIGAYEYTVLTCVEDAQRRHANGEPLVKYCAPEFEGIEFSVGSIHWYLLMVLSLLGLGLNFRRR